MLYLTLIGFIMWIIGCMKSSEDRSVIGAWDYVCTIGLLMFVTTPIAGGIMLVMRAYE